MNTIPRCIRNNNPGNIIANSAPFQGEVRPSRDAHFKQFVSMAYGFRALMKIVHTKYAKGRRTVRAIISEWAPPTENDTNAYIDRVCKALKVERDEVLHMNPTVYRQIAAAIFDVEKGNYKYDATKDISEGFELCHFNDVNYL